MMKNYDQLIKINQNTNWPYIPNHPQRIEMVVRNQGNQYQNLIKNQQADIDKTYLYVKDPFELKYQLLIKVKKMQELKI